VVIDPRTRRVLWVGRERSRAAVRPFFELLGAAGCAQIRAVAMDMSAADAGEVRAHCPNAEMVYELFHVVAKYGREVVHRVRVDEANRPRDDKPACKVVKSARWQQTHRLRLPRRRRLLPQNPRRLPRKTVMNRKNRPPGGAGGRGH
jgi:transposase